MSGGVRRGEKASGPKRSKQRDSLNHTASCALVAKTSMN